MAVEYRVRWERDGRQPATRIYQSWEAACKKARGVQAMDAVKAGTRFENLPDLVGPPELQVRDVGEWRAHDHQQQATEYDEQGMREWVRWNEPVPAATASEGSPF